LKVVQFDLEVGLVSFLVVGLISCLEEDLSLVDLILVDHCLVGHLNLVVGLWLVDHLNLVVVLFILLVVVPFLLLVVLLYLPYFQFFLLAHQLSTLIQALHLQWYWLKYLDLSVTP
jgi:hypothetical protein